jgi:hypothetical protein
VTKTDTRAKSFPTRLILPPDARQLKEIAFAASAHQGVERGIGICNHRVRLGFCGESRLEFHPQTGTRAARDPKRAWSAHIAARIITPGRIVKKVHSDLVRVAQLPDAHASDTYEKGAHDPEPGVRLRRAERTRTSGVRESVDREYRADDPGQH